MGTGRLMQNGKSLASSASVTGQGIAGGLAVSARAVRADAALITDMDRRKCVALWVDSASAGEIHSELDLVCSTPVGLIPAAILSSCFPSDAGEALGFAPALGWSSEALVVGPRRYRLTFAWRQPPQDPPGNDDETAAVVHALLRGSWDREQLAILETRLIGVSRLALLAKVAAAAGHDFNNLLGRIIGSAELALDRVGSDAQARAELELLICTAEQGAGVVRRLSALAALPIAEPLSFDVSLLLQGYAYAETGLRLTTGSAPVLVHADPIIVSAIILAVVQDARERGATHIDLAAATLKGPGGAEITIGDDGQEPAPAPPGALSDRFFTAGSGLAAGLGPDFLRAAIAESRGRLERASTRGVGVKVRLTLPGAVADPSPEPALTPNTTL